MSMFTLFIKDSFSAAHRLEEYQGKCETLHGHNFMVEVSVAGETLNTTGMLIDFTILKEHLREVLKTLDHSYINEIPFFRERAASSEYIAMYIFQLLRTRINERSVILQEVKVWESESACASYHE